MAKSCLSRAKVSVARVLYVLRERKLDGGGEEGGVLRCGLICIDLRRDEERE